MPPLSFRPKYITFDCYGTLTRFRMTEMSRGFYGDTLTDAAMAAFLKTFSAYRFDEILGDWKPYRDVIHRALERACKAHGLPFDAGNAQLIYEAIPTWGPHEDVPAGLARAAEDFPLVALSNAADAQIMSNVDKLGAPFSHVFTAEQAGAYKPRLCAFEYMFDHLRCGPEDVLHVSCHFRYDLISATDLGIGYRLFVDRGVEPDIPVYRDGVISGIDELPALLGLV